MSISLPMQTRGMRPAPAGALRRAPKADYAVAQSIRMSPLSDREAARHWDLDISYVSAIRRGEVLARPPGVRPADGPWLPEEFVLVDGVALVYTHAKGELLVHFPGGHRALISELIAARRDVRLPRRVRY